MPPVFICVLCGIYHQSTGLAHYQVFLHTLLIMKFLSVYYLIYEKYESSIFVSESRLPSQIAKGN